MIAAVPFTMDRFRKVLRAERKARIGGRDKHAARSGINKTTIQNAEIGPDVPKIDTIARLVEALPGLTLRDFFAKVETDHATPTEGVRIVPSGTKHADPAAETHGSEHEPVPAITEADYRVAIHTLAQFAVLEAERADGANRRLPPGHPRAPSVRSKSHQKRVRRTAARKKPKRPRKDT